MWPNVSEGIRRLVSVVIGLIVIGVFLWAVNVYIPMAQSIKDILNIVVVVATCVFVLQAFGLWPAIVRIWYDLTARVLPPHPRA
jgi:undecaprenyl pyrophosphate phosphatase UppP